MDILEDTAKHNLVVQACTDIGCTINNTNYTESFFISKQDIIPWPVTHLNAINPETLQPLIDKKPECIIFGTGPDFHFLSDKQMAPLINHHIGYEFMCNNKACGCYNLLVSDGRDILLAILLASPQIFSSE